MTIDGANIGVKPERALKSILGGADQPAESERLSKEKMLAEILATPDAYEDSCQTYDAGALWLAKQFYFLRKEGVEGDTFAMFEAMKKSTVKRITTSRVSWWAGPTTSFGGCYLNRRKKTRQS